MSVPGDRLPDSVKIGGRRYLINTDFRAGISYEQALLKRECSLEEILALYYPMGVPEDPEEALEQVIWFYCCGQAESSRREKSAPTGRAYDFEQDADALYAGFYTAYGIDLEQASLHWWKFRRLMFGLPADCAFMQRVHYRLADTKGMSKGEKKHYEKMKKLFALKDTAQGRLTLEERNARMLQYVDLRYREAFGDG